MRAVAPEAVNYAEQIAQELGTRLMFRADFFVEPQCGIGSWSVCDKGAAHRGRLLVKLNEIQHWWGLMWDELKNFDGSPLRPGAPSYSPNGVSLTNGLFFQEAARFMTELYIKYS